jgi:hydrogenase maturation protease
MNPPEKPRVKIIGVGQEWRGDDAAGLLVARRLGESLQGRASVLEIQGRAGDLLEAWSEAELVIVADAASSGAPPGKIHRYAAHLEPVPSQLFASCSTHALGLAEALNLGRLFQELPPALIIYGIEGKNFGLGEGLSPEVSRAVAEVARRILLEVEEISGCWLGGGG